MSRPKVLTFHFNLIMINLILLLFAVPVYSNIPNFAWDCANTPFACINYCYAVQCGEARNVQTRAPNDRTQHRINRVRSGSEASPCQSLDFLKLKGGFSCDEFPFASSLEGGYGAYLRCIPYKENSRQGGMISGFFKQTKIEPNGKDKYKILVQNADKLPYCEAKVPEDCKTDGQQFHTTWELNKRGLEEQTTMLVPDIQDSDEGSANVTTSTPVRKFVTASGVELWLHGGITDDIVGEEVWLDRNRTHPDVIAQEISEHPFDR
ncbi:deoxyribonuclease NucA/NucB-domain-containing protein [Aspergillus carlsbadensis]|nr:deoxyribonuclease NucA/NucB-domain-containing protein [Aspergillus carlsbadensis]